MSEENINKGLEYILEKVLSERKAIEFFECLWSGGSVTVDAKADKLLLVAGEDFRKMMNIETENPRIAEPENDYANEPAFIGGDAETVRKFQVAKIAELEAEAERLKLECADVVKLEAENADYFDTVAELRKELSTLAIESVNRAKVLAKLEAEVLRIQEGAALELENDYAQKRAAAVEKLLDGLGLPNAKSLAGLTEIELMAAAEKIAELEKENEKLRLAVVRNGLFGETR